MQNVDSTFVFILLLIRDTNSYDVKIDKYLFRIKLSINYGNDLFMLNVNIVTAGLFFFVRNNNFLAW